MKRDFPQLRQFFEGYLHEDFVAEYRTPAGALRAFSEDANAAERRRLAADAKRLLPQLESASLDEIRARLEELGARWSPRSRQAAVTFLDAVSRASF